VEIASLAGDLQGLTPLIIAAFLFVAALIFHKQIKLIVERLTKIDVKRGKTHVQADLVDSADEQDEEESPTSSSGPDGESTGETRVIDAAGSDEEPQDIAQIRGQMMRAYMSGDASTGDAKYSELLTCETDTVERKKDQIRQVSTKIVGGIGSDGFAKLDEMSKDDEIASFCFRMTGIALSAVEKPVEAADAYSESARTAKTPDEKASAVTLRAEILSKIGRSDEAEAELTENLREADDDSVVAKLWLGLASLYERTKQSELRAFALHNKAKAEGNNSEAWFQAGYAFSHASAESHLDILTLHCYLNSLYFDSERVWAINNLGVALNELEMPLLAVERYKQALELGNSLSGANLADKLIRAGFRDEAEKLIAEASEADDVHENVAIKQAALDADLKKQNEKFDEIAAAGTRTGQFMATYATQRLEATPSIALNWKRKSYDVAVQIEGSGKIELSWEEGSYRGHRRFTGTASGATLFGKFETESASSWRSEMSWEDDGVGYAYFDPGEGRDLHFIKLKDDKATYLDLNAVAPADPA
jgi:tetratricopeptide (TPR) repeat protein